jgi:hypothetical protein
MIEDALRETFAAKVDGSPSLSGVADRAIMQSRRLRQRRAVGTALAGVIAIAVAGVVTLQAVGGTFGRRPSGGSGTDVAASGRGTAELTTPASVDTPSPAARPLEVFVDGEIQAENRKLLTVQGKTRGLSVARAFRASDGYLLVAQEDDPARQELLLVDQQGKQTLVVDKAMSIAVSANGSQVAWRDAAAMYVADRVAGGKLTKKHSVAAPTGNGGPIDFVGTDVLLGQTQTGGGLDSFDLWHPDHNAYTETWSTDIVLVHGAQPDGKGLYAEVVGNPGTKQTCLARLVPAQPSKNMAFTVVQKACGLPEPLPSSGGVSPDGHWLAYTVLGGDGTTRMALIGLDNVFQAKPPAPQYWEVSPVHTVWLGPSMLAVDTGSQIVSIDPTQPSRKADPMQVSNPGKVLIQPLANS